MNGLYLRRPATVDAARWAPPANGPVSVERAEYEGFLRLHQLAEASRNSFQWSARRSLAPGWIEVPAPSENFPWVVVDTIPENRQRVVYVLSEETFTEFYEPTSTEADRELERRRRLRAYIDSQIGRADHVYLLLSAEELDRPPWTDPWLRAERERITALCLASGRPYHETVDPERLDRAVNQPPDPSTLRINSDFATVLQVLVEHGEPLNKATLTELTGFPQAWTASRLVDRLAAAGWLVATVRRDCDLPEGEQRVGAVYQYWVYWGLTEAGRELAHRRLAGRRRAATGNGRA